MQLIVIVIIVGLVAMFFYQRGGSDLTKDQRKAVKKLEKYNGNLKKAAEELDISTQALRSRADQAAKKLGRKDLYDKNTM